MGDECVRICGDVMSPVELEDGNSSLPLPIHFKVSIIRDTRFSRQHLLLPLSIYFKVSILRPFRLSHQLFLEAKEGTSRSRHTTRVIGLLGPRKCIYHF